MMKRVHILLLIAVPFLVFAITPNILKAQSDLSIPGQINDLQEQISSTMYPEIPKPGEQVTITLEAYGTDLNRANITWTRNGQQELKGTGEKVFTFTAGGVGSTNNIKASITPTSGPVIEKTFAFTPAEIDLLWEASTYTPPFYKGKALFTAEADVTFVAMPNMIVGGSRISPSEGVYKWKVDRVVSGDLSGYGKNVFKYSGSIILRPHLIQVEGYAQKNPAVSGLSGVTLEATNPQAVIYEDHPLYGLLFNKAITSTFNMIDNEKKLATYPYYFSTANKNVGVIYRWNINESIIQAPDTQNTMSFQKTASDIGTADIRVSLTSKNKLLQAADSIITLYFNNDSGVFLRQ